MARTQEEILNEIVAEKQTFANLNELLPSYDLAGLTPENPFKKLIQDCSSASKVAYWRLTAWLTADAIHTAEVKYDEFIEEAEIVAENAVTLNLPWWQDQIKKWQYGYPLLFNLNTFKYYYADTTTPAAVAARIVAKVSPTEVLNDNFRGVKIKVAKDDGNGNLIPLDDTPGTEKDSLNTYVIRIKGAGVQTEVVNLPSDKTKQKMRVYYDGTLVLADFKIVFEAALKQFFKDIEFNGVLYLNDEVDAIQKVPGTKQPWVLIQSCLCRADAESVYTAVNESYEPKSGYFSLVAIGDDENVNTVIEYVPV